MAKPKIKCGVIGVGSLGQHHARIYASLPGAVLAVLIFFVSSQRVDASAVPFACESPARSDGLVAFFQVEPGVYHYEAGDTDSQPQYSVASHDYEATASALRGPACEYDFGTPITLPGERRPHAQANAPSPPSYHYDASVVFSAAESVTWRNGWRTADGKFASPLGAGRSGAAAEQSVWDAVRQKPGWSVVEGRVSVRNAAGDLRVYDGAAISPRGRVIGLEVKSGDAVKTASQRAFDAGVSTVNPAVGVGDDAGLIIGRTLEIRR